jgi:hypothetical protein
MELDLTYSFNDNTKFTASMEEFVKLNVYLLSLITTAI